MVEIKSQAGGVAGVRQTGVVEIVGHEAYEHERANPSKRYIVTEYSSSPPSTTEASGSTAWEGAGAAEKVLLTGAPMRKMRYA